MSQVGKRTEVFVRFSTVAGGLGGPEAVRDPRGFAIKFYTEAGNYDLTGNNTPIFFIRDPLKFPDFIHSQKPDPLHKPPRTGQCVGLLLFLSPEATHMFTWLFSGGSWHSGELPAHERLRLAYLPVGQRHRRAVLRWFP